MPFAPAAGTRLHYEMRGTRGKRPLVLSNSLGADLSMWDAQVAALGTSFCVIRYDTRGHGASEPTPGPYSIGQLASDVLALLDHLQVARAHFCGLSLGGMTGMWLGANAADRIDRLVLANTAARVAQPELYDARIAKVKADGMASISEAVMQRWFTPEFTSAEPATVARMQSIMERVPVEGYGGCCAAVRDMDLRHDLARIAAPTLVITGSRDAATPAADGELIAAGIPGARLTQLPAAHLSNIEQAAAFTAAITAFLAA
jgi:3-oxoadipate enol-lactonase